MMTIREFFDWAEKEGFADFVLSVYANQGESSKRVHQLRLNDIELTNYNAKGVTLHARNKRNQRKDD